MSIYLKTGEYFAVCRKSAEEYLALELQELGAKEVKADFCGVNFKANLEALYKINYCSRLSSRILAPLLSFKCNHSDDIYKSAKKIDWKDYFNPDMTFAVFSSVSNSNIKNSHFASLKLKDGIADYFRDNFKERPFVDLKEPDIYISLKIKGNKAIISIDTAGGKSLHMRGYREKGSKAPLQETLAATMLSISEWKGETPLYDFMCGSGTILSEAALSYCRIPSAYNRRKFAFENFAEYDKKLWHLVKENCDNQIRELPDNLIAGSDIKSRVIKSAAQNIKLLPEVCRNIELKARDFKELGDLENKTIIFNPPYGKRLKNKEDVQKLYKETGDFLKQKCKGSTAWILCGSKELTKFIGLRISKRIILFNGPIETRFVKIELY